MEKLVTFIWDQSLLGCYEVQVNHDGIMIISVIVYMLTNYLGMPLVYLTSGCFFDDSEGVYVNVKLEIM